MAEGEVEEPLTNWKNELVVPKSEQEVLRFLERELRDKGLHASLIAKELNYDDKVFVRFESSEDSRGERHLKVEGLICPEYYLVRKIVFSSSVFI